MASDKHFSFKYFLKNAFVSMIFPKSSGLFRLLMKLRPFKLYSYQSVQQHYVDLMRGVAPLTRRSNALQTYCVLCLNTGKSGFRVLLMANSKIYNSFGLVSIFKWCFWIFHH